MPPPTREQVNALIADLKGYDWSIPCKNAHAALTALRDENDRLRAQASPAWVALSVRKPTKEDADEHGLVLAIYNNGVTDTLRPDSVAIDAVNTCVTHWQRLPAPPESAADRQRREDEEAFEEWVKLGLVNFRACYNAGIAHARKEATP